MAGLFARLSQVSTNCRSLQVRHTPDLHMPRLLAATLENLFGICELGSPIEAEVHMILSHTDVANAVLDTMCWPVEQCNRVHFQDVLATRRQLFDYHLPKREREFLDSAVVWFKEFEKFFRWLNHGSVVGARRARRSTRLSKAPRQKRGFRWGRSFLLFERRLPHLSILLLSKGVQPFPKLRAVSGKNRDGEQGGVYGAGFADGQCADGNAGGHLHH